VLGDELCGATVESVEFVDGADPGDWAKLIAGIEARIARANHFFIFISLSR